MFSLYFGNLHLWNTKTKTGWICLCDTWTNLGGNAVLLTFIEQWSSALMIKIQFSVTEILFSSWCYLFYVRTCCLFLLFVVADCVYINVIGWEVCGLGCEPVLCTAGSPVPSFVLQLQRTLIQSTGLLNSRQLIHHSSAWQANRKDGTDLHKRLWVYVHISVAY